MKTTDIIRRSGRNLRRAKTRTLLTSMAIGVGAFAITISLMVGEGARQYADRILGANMDPQSISISKEDMLVSGGASPELSGLKEYDPNMTNMYGVDIKSIDQKDLENLKKRDDIKDVQPFFALQPKYVTFGVKKDKKYVASATPRENYLAQSVAAGKSLNKGDDLAKNEAAIPEDYLETLGAKNPKDVIDTEVTITVDQPPQDVSQEEILQALQTGGEEAAKNLTKSKEVHRKLKIVSVLKKTPESMSNQPAVYINAEVASELNDVTTRGTDDHKKYMSAVAMVKDGVDPEDVKQAIKEDLDLDVATARDVQQMIFTFINVLQAIVLGFGALALLVSVFGIVNTMYISVLERTQQIGLMKAMGASGRDIGRMFRYEAGWVGFLGAAIGIILAVGAATIANPYVSKAIGFGDESLFIFLPWMGLVVLVVLVFIGIESGRLPARKAAKLDPIEALRTD